MLSQTQRYGLTQFFKHYDFDVKYSTNNFINCIIKYSKKFKKLSFVNRSNYDDYYFELDKEDIDYLFNKYKKLYDKDAKIRDLQELDKLVKLQEETRLRIEKHTNKTNR
jgi:hypothetical protein